METPPIQNYGNHRRTVFGYHILLSLLLALNLGNQIVLAWKNYSTAAAFNVLTASALVLAAWYIRQFPRVVQDRIIRLEETIRFQRVLPANLQGRMGEFTPSQFVALRFASDKEPPALAQKVLDEKITKRGDIKKLITNWRPDDLRI